MATQVSLWVDKTVGSGTIATTIATVAPGANRRIAVIEQGNMVRFVGYDIA